MSLPINKPCIFCGGKYTPVKMAEGYEDYEITNLIICKIGTKMTQIVKTIVYQCETCGNVQSFMEREPIV